jgi:hypothetical protein
MNKAIVLLLCIVTGGCYTTMTSVFSSYALEPRARMERQQKRYYEASPELLLNSQLSVSFYSTPGRSLKPKLETCEEAMSDELTMIFLTNTDLSLDLTKMEILSDGKRFKVSEYKTYDSEFYVPISDMSLLPLKRTSKSVVDYARRFNLDPIATNKEFDIKLSEMTGVSLLFDGEFSCGENHYEMVFANFNHVTKKEETYRIFFFPWKDSITPH